MKRKSKAGRPRDPNKKVPFAVRLRPHVLAELKDRAQKHDNGACILAETFIKRGLRGSLTQMEAARQLRALADWMEDQ